MPYVYSGSYYFLDLLQRLSRCNASITKYIDFADDKKIIHNSISSANDTDILQASIDDFFDWCTENGLELNEEKCKVMSISRK